MLVFYRARVIVEPHTIMYATQIWSPKLRYEVAELEAVQRKLTKLVAGERNRSYGQRLADLDLLFWSHVASYMIK
jgi:hypothetical protein